jgi:hypothetical protein
MKAQHAAYFSLLLVFFSGAAFAKETLWLSDVRTGDCVAPRISSAKTQFNHKADKAYCAKYNAGSAEKIKTCQDNSLTNPNINFFTDRCSASDFYIGINGVEHHLKRLSEPKNAKAPLLGKFSGKGISVDIKALRLLSTNHENEDGTGEVIGGTYEVMVTVTKNKITKQTKATLDFGP